MKIKYECKQFINFSSGYFTKGQFLTCHDSRFVLGNVNFALDGKFLEVDYWK